MYEIFSGAVMKDEILQTSLKQFLKYGIREMSIQKLVAPLGISTKTVYKYFKNKEKLLEAALKLYYTDQFSLWDEFSEGKDAASLLFDLWYTGLENECKVNKLFFDDLKYYYPEVEKKIEAGISKRVWESFTGIIQKGKEEAIFREDIKTEMILEAISCVYTAIARKGQFKKFRSPVNIIFLNTISVFIRGICTSKGIRELDQHIASLHIINDVALKN